MKRRLSYLLTSLLLALATVFGAGVSPASANGATATYVALGDSFAAGTYVDGVNPGTSPCTRSDQAYPSLIASQLGLSASQNVACLGAYTKDVVSPQPPIPVPAQTAALGPSTEVVTLTVGGMDAGFGAFTACLSGGCDQTQLALRVGKGILSLSGVGSATVTDGDRTVKLTSLSKVIAQIHQAAPGATIYVSGYPIILGTGSGPLGVCTANKKLVSQVNLSNAVLNSTIRSVVTTAKLRDRTLKVTYVDVASRFGTTHGVCGDMTLVGPQAHPTVAGQQVYADAFKAAIGS